MAASSITKDGFGVGSREGAPWWATFGTILDNGLKTLLERPPSSSQDWFAE